MHLGWRLLMLIGYCTLWLPRAAALAPLPPYQVAMRPTFEADVLRSDLPQYSLAIRIDPPAGTLNGKLHLQFPNTTGTTLHDLVLRLYPNFPQDVFGDGGNLNASVSDARVNGLPVDVTYDSSASVVHLPLPRPSAPGATIDVALAWQATVRPLHGTDDTLPLPSYYPQLAVWDAGGWRTDITRFPDHVYAVSGLYQVSLTVPHGWDVVHSGTAVGTNDDGVWTTTNVVSGPIREFAFGVGHFAVARASHDGTSIAVMYRRGSGLDADAHRIALHAAASLAVYNERYGPYPFRNLNIHLLDASRGFDIGSEYPGYILLLLNHRYTDETRFVVAHEVAHQWFYGMLGDDIYREPWLDESFAQFSPLLVEEKWAGPAAADVVYHQQIARLAARAHYPAGLSIDQYGSWNTY